MELIKKSGKSDLTDLCTRPLFRKILLFSLPLMLSGMLQLLYNAADIIVLGRFASDASAGAVGSTGSLINLLTNLFIGLSVGASSAAAKWIGAGNKDKLDKIVHTSLCISLISGVVIGIIGIIFARSFLIMMNVPQDSVLPLSTLYLKIYFAGMPFNFVYNFASALLRAQGDTKRPLIILFVSGIVNVSLNLLLVITFKMDVAGVAIATITSQALCAVLVIIFLIKQKGPCKLIISHLKISKDALGEIMIIGLPAGIQSCIFSFSNVIIQSSINSFGNVAITANAESSNIEGFIYISMNSVSQAALTFSGQNYGALKSKNIDVALVDSIIISTIIGLALGLSVYFSSDYIMRIYTDSPEIITIAKGRMLIICTTYFLDGIMEILTGIMRGMGHSIAPMLVSILGVCGIRIIYIYTVFAHFHTLPVLYLSYPITWIITSAVHAIFLLAIRKKEFRKIDNLLKSSQKSTSAETVSVQD